MKIEKILDAIVRDSSHDKIPPDILQLNTTYGGCFVKEDDDINIMDEEFWTIQKLLIVQIEQRKNQLFSHHTYYTPVWVDWDQAKPILHHQEGDQVYCECHLFNYRFCSWKIWQYTVDSEEWFWPSWRLYQGQEGYEWFCQKNDFDINKGYIKQKKDFSAQVLKYEVAKLAQDKEATYQLSLNKFRTKRIWYREEYGAFAKEFNDMQSRKV